jgi:hypothetical protein
VHLHFKQRLNGGEDTARVICDAFLDAPHYGNCFDVINTEKYRDQCYYDVCSATNDQQRNKSLCILKMALALDCLEHGAQLGDDFVKYIMNNCPGRKHI